MNPTDMPAGREFDALVSERVMGVPVMVGGLVGVPRIALADGRQAPVPFYSTDIAAAWLVFTRALTDHGHASIDMDMEDYGRESGDIAWVSVGLDESFSVMGPAPWAICVAALRANEREQARATGDGAPAREGR